MRVALLSRNCCRADAIGTQVVAKIAYFQQLGAEVRLYLSEDQSLRGEASALKPIVGTSHRIWNEERERDYLLSSDLVVAEYGAAYNLMNLLPALSGRGPRIVIDYRGVTPVEFGDTGLQPELEAAVGQRALLWYAEAVIVQSQFAAEELRQNINLPSERIHQLPCWIAPTRDDEPLLANRLREKHGLAGAKIVLFVGRQAANKQPEMLIHALTRLSRDTHTIFVGCQSSAYQQRLDVCRQLADRLNVTERVHFIGSVPEAELAGWYRAADVLCLPSRHECFGMPVIEAMQRGIPVVCSDASSLPEIIGHAGFTAGVDDVEEMALQIKRCQAPAQVISARRIALVTHRFGTQFAGGAEKSLRLMATALQSQGYVIEIFTTCNEHENRWANTLASGTSLEDGFTVHRYPIDGYDAEKLGLAYDMIRRADGQVHEDIAQQYLQNSLGSKTLIDALAARGSEFAAILTGPYLFKLTYEAAKTFGEQVLLAPCFHDEPLARLSAFQKVYRQVGGLLFHTESEALYTATKLAINHPRNNVVGTILDEAAFHGDAQRGQARTGSKQYLVYCGRYCPEKGLDRLLQYMEELHAQGNSTIKLVCMGQGPMKLPNRPWLIGLGFVSEEVKRDVIAGALALVNLSWNESLSIVALEAWALHVPVIGDAECNVLVDQISKAQGGVAVKNSVGFTTTVNEWLNKLTTPKTLGQSGHRFVKAEYASSLQYGQRLDEIVQSLQVPLSDIASKQGLHRSRLFAPNVWQQRLSAILEQVSMAPATKAIHHICIEPLQKSLVFAKGTPSGTITFRLCNRGETALAAKGPAKASVIVKVMATSGKVLSQSKVALPSPLIPEQEQLLVASFELPETRGQYRLKMRLMRGRQIIARLCLRLTINRSDQGNRPSSPHTMGPMLQSARSALSQAKRIENLPEDYVDVSEGKLAGLKRSLKRKLLNNFRKAYVDVAFRQQSDLNEKLIAVMSLLLETVSTQDTAQNLADLQRRLHRLERDLKREQLRNQQLSTRLEQLSSPDVSLMEGT
ncbi:MAG TPA: glycosyltransferase family 4 protein [Gemmatales bacterium]|nr:glycosyltransferase family 4 protein [Gemmatales bacterium]